MIEEPPSTSPESNKGLGFFKKIRLFLRGLYKRVSYTPMNQKELSGVLKEAEEMNLIDKNILDMMEETLEFSSMQVRDVMIPRPQMITSLVRVYNFTMKDNNKKRNEKGKPY